MTWQTSDGGPAASTTPWRTREPRCALSVTSTYFAKSQAPSPTGGHQSAPLCDLKAPRRGLDPILVHCTLCQTKRRQAFQHRGGPRAALQRSQCVDAAGMHGVASSAGPKEQLNTPLSRAPLAHSRVDPDALRVTTVPVRRHSCGLWQIQSALTIARGATRI